MANKPAFPPASTTNNKRKPNDDPNETTAPAPQTIQKRQRTALIDDPTAITILQELGLDQQFFDGGKVLAWGLQPNDPDFLRIHMYIERGQGWWCGVKIQSILRIIPSVHVLNQNPNAYLDFKDDPKAAGMKRMMLWHGTKQANVKGILEDGLKLPNHAGLYGPGIYFADMVCKSCQYTDYPTDTRNCQVGKVGYLFLSDVLLGNVYEAFETNRKLTKPPPMNVTPWWQIGGQQQFAPRQSVMATDEWGGYGPSSLGDEAVDGCTWPMGYAWGLGNTYHEYIVYDVNQVKPKFLVKFEYTKTPYYPKIS